MDFELYEKIENTTTILKIYRTRLTPEQYRALRKQAIAGDPDGALKELRAIMRRRKANE